MLHDVRSKVAQATADLLCWCQSRFLFDLLQTCNIVTTCLANKVVLSIVTSLDLKSLLTDDVVDVSFSCCKVAQLRCDDVAQSGARTKVHCLVTVAHQCHLLLVMGGLC